MSLNNITQTLSIIRFLGSKMKRNQKEYSKLLKYWEEYIETGDLGSDEEKIEHLIRIEREIISLSEGIVSRIDHDLKESIIHQFELTSIESEYISLAYIILNANEHTLFTIDKNIFNEYISNILISDSDVASLLTILNYCQMNVTQMIQNALNNVIFNAKADIDAERLHELSEENLLLIDQYSIASNFEPYFHQFREGLRKQEPNTDLLDAAAAIQFKPIVDDVLTLLKQSYIHTDELYTTRRRLYHGLLKLGAQEILPIYTKEVSKQTIYYTGIQPLGYYGGPTQSIYISEHLSKLDTLSAGLTEAYVMVLGNLGDLSILERLIEIFDKSDNVDVQRACLDAYAKLTGQTENIEVDLDDEDRENVLGSLKEWWKEDQDNFTLGRRYENGELFSIERLIDNLTSPYDDVRLISKERLMAYTGVSFPINVDGFFIHMMEQQKLWYDWWDKNKERFPDGYWYLGGAKLT